MTDSRKTFGPGHRFFSKLRNTFLYRHWWYLKRTEDPKFWGNLVQSRVSSEPPSTVFGYLRNRATRYLGIDTGYIARWAKQCIDGGDDPRSFVEIDSSSKVLIEHIISRASGFDVPILDLGCNCGRHLNALMGLGFTKLYGVDIGRGALDYMDEVFPGLSKQVEIRCTSFQQYLLETPDQFFEIVYTRGATVELVHPSFPLVRQLTRVTRKYVILCIQENSHSYPRFWTYEFERAGFVLVKLVRPAVDPVFGDLPSLLVYRRYILNKL